MKNIYRFLKSIARAVHINARDAVIDEGPCEHRKELRVLNAIEELREALTDAGYDSESFDFYEDLDDSEESKARDEIAKKSEV